MEKISKTVKKHSCDSKLSVYLPRSSLLTTYKLCVGSHLDYGFVIYDQPNNYRLSEKIESVQYNAAIAITGASRGTSKEKMYQACISLELGLNLKKTENG